MTAELYERTYALEDIEIQRGGDGRTVTAYAAVFDTPAEIRDVHGHYHEVISRTAFNRTLSHGISRTRVHYNHGYDLSGRPNMLGAVPIGTPLEIRPDERGLVTVTRYNKTALAESVLEAIRAGDIKGQSFRGRVHQSTTAKGGALPTITRTELGLSEYGPTPAPAYVGAGIMAVRSAQMIAESIAGLDADERAELIRYLSSTPTDSLEHPATPESGPGAEDPPSGHSGRLTIARTRVRMDLIAAGVRNGQAP